jgi:hypothetical protein
MVTGYCTEKKQEKVLRIRMINVSWKNRMLFIANNRYLANDSALAATFTPTLHKPVQVHDPWPLYNPLHNDAS